MNETSFEQKKYFVSAHSKRASVGSHTLCVLPSKRKTTSSPHCSEIGDVSVEQSLSWKLLEELPDGVVVTGTDRRILFANSLAKELLDLATMPESSLVFLPQKGMITVFTSGEKRTLEVTSRTVKHDNQTLIISCLRDTTLLLKQIEKLSYHSFIDELTGLYNRRGFLAVAQHRFDSARRQNRNLVVIFADMDGLKEINDTLGHAAGDSSIKDLAEILKTSLRSEDVVARMGGDEFVVLTTIEENEDSESLIARLKNDIAQFNQKNQRQYSLQASFGFSVIKPDNAVDLADVIRRADMEMYQEKRRRRSKSALFTV